MYFNGVKSPVEVRLLEDTTCLTVLTSKLKDLFPDAENRKVGKIDFCADWIDTDGKVKDNFIELKTDEELKVM